MVKLELGHSKRRRCDHIMTDRVPAGLLCALPIGHEGPHQETWTTLPLKVPVDEGADWGEDFVKEAFRSGYDVRLDEKYTSKPITIESMQEAMRIIMEGDQKQKDNLRFYSGQLPHEMVRHRTGIPPAGYSISYKAGRGKTAAQGFKDLRYQPLVVPMPKLLINEVDDDHLLKRIEHYTHTMKLIEPSRQDIVDAMEHALHGKEKKLV